MYKIFLCLLTLFLILGCSKSGADRKDWRYLVQNQTNGSEIVEIEYSPPPDPSKGSFRLFAFATKELKPGECILLTGSQFEDEGITIQAGEGGVSDSTKRLCGRDRSFFSDDHDHKTCERNDYAIVDKGAVLDDYKLERMTTENREELLKSNSCTPFEKWSISGFTTNEAKESTEDDE